jgi:hypothetical protein
MRSRLVLLILLWSSCQSGFTQNNPLIPGADRIRLAEAFKLAESVGNRVWKDWDKAPFAVLLVTPEYEFLIRHPAPSSDFMPLGYDSLLNSDVYYRKRTQPTSFLATFPAVKGSMVSTIVVGQAENTLAKTSTPWVVTLLHEHFHQLQYSQPGYYRDVSNLNLSHGDQTGMWMLNYAFPYDKKEVQDQFSALSRLLVEAVEARRSDRSTKLAAYLDARQRLQQMLAADDYRYISFQFWQEGIARYTEYRIAKLAAANFKPSRAFQALKDYKSFAQTGVSIRETIFRELLTQKLDQSRREVVYPFGAAEGLLLDVVNPGWRGRYLIDKFDLSKYYPTISKRREPED